MKPFRDGSPREILTAVVAVIGALAVVFVPIALAAMKFLPSYEEVSREQFGTPEALNDLIALYAKVEASPHDPALESIDVIAIPPCAAKCRRIPRAWLPERFRRDWSVDRSQGWGSALPRERAWPTEVLGYYDAKDRLIGVQFGRSRLGCFISRDAMACPDSFESLHRLRHEPPYVTTYVGRGLR